MKEPEGQGEQKDFEVVFAIHFQCRNVSSNMGSFTVLCVSGTGTFLSFSQSILKQTVVSWCYYNIKVKFIIKAVDDNSPYRY